MNLIKIYNLHLKTTCPDQEEQITDGIGYNAILEAGANRGNLEQVYEILCKELKIKPIKKPNEDQLKTHLKDSKNHPEDWKNTCKEIIQKLKLLQIENTENPLEISSLSSKNWADVCLSAFSLIETETADGLNPYQIQNDAPINITQTKLYPNENTSHIHAIVTLQIKKETQELPQTIAVWPTTLTQKITQNLPEIFKTIPKIVTENTQPEDINLISIENIPSQPDGQIIKTLLEKNTDGSWKETTQKQNPLELPTVNLGEEDCTMKISFYNNSGNTAIQLNTLYGEPMAKVTTNTDLKTKPTQIVVKNYNENTGALNALIQAGIGHPLREIGPNTHLFEVTHPAVLQEISKIRKLRRELIRENKIPQEQGF